MSLILMSIAVLFVIYIIRKIYIKNWSHGIEADIEVSKNTTFPGDELILTETVVNRKWLPLPMVTVKFEVDRSFVFGNEVVNTNVSDYSYKSDVFSLLFYQKITRNIPLVCTRRGYYKINRLDIVSTDVMMDKTLTTYFDIDKAVTVYPAEVLSDDIDIPYRRIMGTVLTRQYTYEDPFEFLGIRQYQTYDSLKDVNWTASAKTGELKVNVHAHTASQQVCILLNLENDGVWNYEDLKEKAISMACSLACRLTRQAVSVSLLSNGCDILTGNELVIEAGCDDGHRSSIMTALARIDLKKQSRDFEAVIEEHVKELGNDMIYCMISTSRRIPLQKYFVELTGGASDSMWIYPCHKSFERNFDYLGGTDVVCWEVEHE